VPVAAEAVLLEIRAKIEGKQMLATQLPESEALFFAIFRNSLL
jgi:hypothetical protein